MPKITAIHGGGDWADASAEYLVLPGDMDIGAERAAYDNWYENVYRPSINVGRPVSWMSFADWLLKEGAREPESDEIEIVWDGP